MPRLPLLPDYYDSLLDLLARVRRRREQGAKLLRYLEWVTLAGNAGYSSGDVEQILGAVDPIAVKLCTDVGLFLADAARMPREFADSFVEMTNSAFGTGQPLMLPM